MKAKRTNAGLAGHRTPPVSAKPVSNTLDGGWDRRLGTGRVSPDHVIDLHGHTLESAWRYLDQGLDRAMRHHARIVLLITGKARDTDRTDSGRGGPERRGIIRAKVGDWLAMSRFSSQIAAVRNAHPRHGGQGALYVIMRRQRDDG
jgi:DNA-nicking Smr family endonuclease